MSDAGRSLFSDSWHRVAGEQVRLNPAVQVHRQTSRGRVWYLLRDPLNNEFFRVSAPAYAFLGRLRAGRTVDEVWRECLDLDPAEAPGQDEVIRLLSQLHRANLLHSPVPPDATQLFRRRSKARAKQARAQALNFLFVQIPLIDPTRVLDWLLPVVRPLFGPAGALLWLGAVAFGAKTAIENLPALFARGAGVLAPQNLAYLYVCMAGLKLLHELGHALTCRHFGGQVPTLGAMFMIFVPLPYVDTTASWGFRERRRRLAVGAAGMAVEFFIAAAAVTVWATVEDPLVSRLAYNTLVLASVSTFLFNANPLLRFDGYYLLSDLLDLPNLYQRAVSQLRHLAERHLYGVRESRTPANSTGEAVWLTVYGAASFVYRAGLLLFIIGTVSGRFLGLGIAIAAFCLVLYFAVPLLKLVRYLLTNDRLLRTRRRAIAVTAVLGAGLLAPLAFMPAPRHFRAPGIAQAAEQRIVSNRVPGRVVAVLVPTGMIVEAGTALVRMDNPELDLEIESSAARIAQIARQIDEARQGGFSALILALDLERRAAEGHLAELRGQRNELLVRAPRAGIWSVPRRSELVGTWAPRGTEFGRVAGAQRVLFIAVVSQRQAAHLFNQCIVGSEVRLHGDAGRALAVADQTIIPGEQRLLPGPALGWLAGGDVETDREDPSGLTAAQSFYRLEATLRDTRGRSAFPLPRRGQIRCRLPDEPLLAQALRRVRQFVEPRLP